MTGIQSFSIVPNQKRNDSACHPSQKEPDEVEACRYMYNEGFYLGTYSCT